MEISFAVKLEKDVLDMYIFEDHSIKLQGIILELYTSMLIRLSYHRNGEDM